MLSNVELRSMDSTCNPYIVLTAIAKAGMLGMAAKTRLPQPINKYTKDKVGCRCLHRCSATADPAAGDQSCGKLVIMASA